MRTSIYPRYIVTAAILIVAFGVGRYLWNDNMASPWTRDGRIKADVINIAADVSGVVTAVSVRDNQFVKKGDLLFTIDRSRYENALAQAEAALAGLGSEKAMRKHEAVRRAGLDSTIVTSESRESAASQSLIAEARYQAALAARDTAKLNLDRTEVRAPVDGYVTNLRVFAGDYANVGGAKLAIIDSHSFYVFGYFEETKLPSLAVNDPVEIRMLDGRPMLHGHIESISHGITDRDAITSHELLADVNPTFNWVRLAQRVPVRIHIDDLPVDHNLVAGTTCTVVVRPAH